VHLQWRCDLDGVVGAVGVDEDDTACLVSCSCAVAARIVSRRGSRRRCRSALDTAQRDFSLQILDYNNEGGE
jgi:hypothetical protein